MRNILCILTFALMLFPSCEGNGTGRDGDWDPIKFDHNEFTIPANGGTVYSKVLNYNGIWLNDMKVTKEGLKDSEPEYFVPSLDEHLNYNYDSLSCKYAKLSVSKEKNPVIKIEVAPNNEQETLLMRIGVECGDAFSSIIIHQNPAK
ncbi:MAG: hypothetical protein WCS67_07735 [Bacteroidales bacterium]